MSTENQRPHCVFVNTGAIPEICKGCCACQMIWDNSHVCKIAILEAKLGHTPTEEEVKTEGISTVDMSEDCLYDYPSLLYRLNNSFRSSASGTTSEAPSIDKV